MTYHVEYDTSVLKALNKLDVFARNKIVLWIDKNLDGCTNPKLHGKALAGNLKGLWRYRVGNYRLIAHIDEGKVEIRMIKIGDRKDVYR